MVNREVIIFPLIHTDAEMGIQPDATDLESEVANIVASKFRGYLDSINFDPQNTRCYNDSVPNLRYECIEMFLGLAELPLLDYLSGKGLHIMGTEAPKYMLEIGLTHAWMKRLQDQREYNQDMLDFWEKNKISQYLDRRDRYIARRINNTLKENELGLLFIGANHNVERYLAGDINVKVPPEIFLDLPQEVLNVWLDKDYGRYMRLAGLEN